MIRYVLLIAFILGSANFANANNPKENLKEKLKTMFQEVIENKEFDESLIEKNFSKDYIQECDGKTLNYAQFIAHVKALKEHCASIKITFVDIIEEGNKVATRHIGHALKKNGAEIQTLLNAIFEFKDGKLIGCRELTYMMKGDESDRDLGHRQ